MKAKLLDEFIAFAKDEFGVTISVHDSDAPDSFDKIFGDCFSDNFQKISHEKYIYSSSMEKNREYRNERIKLPKLWRTNY